ncbi:MAG: NADH-quinone oxidoreductase subunit J [Haloarculaceae archaeon]
MTSRPRLATDANYLNGAGAVALFAVMAWVFVTAGFPTPLGFEDGSITAAIGYAMFGMIDQTPYDVESFIVAFETIDVVLVAALVGAVMLARREEDGSVVTALTDGGRRLVGADGDAADPSADGSDAAASSADPQDATDEGGDA